MVALTAQRAGVEMHEAATHEAATLVRLQHELTRVKAAACKGGAGDTAEPTVGRPQRWRRRSHWCRYARWPVGRSSCGGVVRPDGQGAADGHRVTSHIGRGRASSTPAKLQSLLRA
jgi:hypothetical protein